MTDEAPLAWYAVRCLFAMEGESGLEDVERIYEERITLWKAPSPEAAVQRAEAEARDYASALASAEFLELAQSYQLFDAPADGVEVFSLLRTSDLSSSAYLNAFFDTGAELQQDSP